jgi:hypothetical protein
MLRLKRSAKRKTRSKAVPVLGVAGITLLAGASVALAHPALEQAADSRTNKIVLNEEEISDVTLATFYAIDHEGQGQGPRATRRIRLALGACGCGCGCGGCGGCWGGNYFPPGPRPVFGDAWGPVEPVRPVQKYRRTYKRTENR